MSEITRDYLAYGFVNQGRGVQGAIGYHGLGEWYLDALSDRDHEAVAAAVDQAYFFEAEHDIVEDSAAETLLRLVDALSPQEHVRSIEKLLAKAEQLAEESGAVLDRFGVLGRRARFHHAHAEEDADALGKAIWAAERQIALAPDAREAWAETHPGKPLPEHQGYEILCAIKAAEENWTGALALCREADEQGWPGDWSDRAETYREHIGAQEGPPEAEEDAIPEAAEAEAGDDEDKWLRDALLATGSEREDRPEPDTAAPEFPTGRSRYEASEYRESEGPLRAWEVDESNYLEHPCPHCFRVLRIPRRFCGQAGRCKFCGGRLVVPPA